MQLDNSIDLDSMWHLMSNAKRLLASNLNEDNVQEKWKTSDVMSEIDLLNKRLWEWQSDLSDYIEFEIVGEKQNVERYDYINVDAENFLMFLGLGIKSLIEHIKTKPTNNAISILFSEKVPLFSNLFFELQNAIKTKKSSVLNPIVLLKQSLLDDY